MRRALDGGGCAGPDTGHDLAASGRHGDVHRRQPDRTDPVHADRPVFRVAAGKEAVAGVASAGSAMFITMSISQLVSAGSLSLVSHAVGRKDQADAQLVFEQALSLALVITAVFLVIGYGLGGWAAGRLAASPPTRRPPIMRALIFSITCR